MQATNDDMDKKSETLKTNLIAMLKARDWSQSELARRSGVAQATISRIIDGSRRGFQWSTVEALARAFDVAPDDLASGVLTNGEPAPEVGFVDVGDLLAAYVASPWYAKDAPTPEELRWIATYGEIMWVGQVPGAGAVHALLVRRRKLTTGQK